MSKQTERTVEIYDMLLRETDQAHPINSKEIMQKRNIVANEDQTLNRKKVYSSIADIKEVNEHMHITVFLDVVYSTTAMNIIFDQVGTNAKPQAQAKLTTACAAFSCPFFSNGTMKRHKCTKNVTSILINIE